VLRTDLDITQCCLNIIRTNIPTQVLLIPLFCSLHFHISQCGHETHECDGMQQPDDICKTGVLKSSTENFLMHRALESRRFTKRL